MYLATFGGRTSFPTTLNPVFWVPVSPAAREVGIYNPIASINTLAQWVSIRKKIAIGEGEVRIYISLWCLLTSAWLTTGDSVHGKTDEESGLETEEVFGPCGRNQRVNQGKFFCNGMCEVLLDLCL